MYINLVICREGWCVLVVNGREEFVWFIPSREPSLVQEVSHDQKE